VIRDTLATFRQRLLFRDSTRYWERRYRAGGTSGAGSYGAQARYKADFLNALVLEEDAASVVELGCGDGNQLSLARYPRYLGLDVSETAVRACIERFADDPTKSFALYHPGLFADPAGFVRADIGLSLDVIYHLIEDDAFDRYMRDLFRSATRLVVIYATDADGRRRAAHVRHRTFSDWVGGNAPGRKLARRAGTARPDHQDFFVFAR
jgi:SAM-dependent methyltransferase